MEEKIIEITLGEYNWLKGREARLRALENAGVDNWEWYGHAMRSLNDEEEE